MDQQEVWNKIAKEWFKFKVIPAKYIIYFLKKQTGKILDLGSGAGRHLTKIKDGKMYLVDFSKQMIEFAKKRAKQKNIEAEFKIAKLNKLPYEKDFFDAAICFSSLHCVETKKARKQTVKELFRVLKPGAKADIGVWNIKSKRFKNSPKEKYIKWRNKGKRYYYLYDEKEIHDLFKKIGFKIIKSHNAGMMINFIIEKPKK